MAQGHDLTLATARKDGWPQANTVSYVNDGMAIYFATETDSQKAKNLRFCDKVSATIDLPYDTWGDIKGLSLAAISTFVTQPEAMNEGFELLEEKFPQMGDYADGVQGTIEIIRLDPILISLIDYARGFGHTELIEM
ncbi:MAG: pyridoxamine 5'-phosphate oxidase family protein [bacterium]|nr:pyridoxamine 5'-phosphate oxidase family protein [bacterium]